MYFSFRILFNFCLNPGQQPKTVHTTPCTLCSASECQTVKYAEKRVTADIADDNVMNTESWHVGNVISCRYWV